MEEAYTGFADVYDKLMDATPYEKWCENIVRELHAQEICDGLVLDLGCGTGNMTQRLAAKGYDMIGVDCADEMLNIAYEKKEQSGYDILYLNQDMREFELYGTVRAVVSVCDSINYLLEDEDVLACFSLVQNYLDPDGIFFFDFNTRYKYETVIGESVIAENREDCSFIWENYFDAADGINEYDLTVFVKAQQETANERALFYQFQEIHFQRGYTFEEMKRFVEMAGLTLLRAYDADTMGEIIEESERICVVAQKCKNLGSVSNLKDKKEIRPTK